MKRLVIAGTTAALLFFGWTGSAHATGSTAKVPAQASKGCKAHAKAPKGETLQKITSGGDKRTYYRFIPKAYNGKKPLPVVMDLHGHTEPVTFHKNASGLGRFGNTHGFITRATGTDPLPIWRASRAVRTRRLTRSRPWPPPAPSDRSTSSGGRRCGLPARCATPVRTRCPEW
jgi:hypothetical protein